jgi:hypothetical protein
MVQRAIKALMLLKVTLAPGVLGVIQTEIPNGKFRLSLIKSETREVTEDARGELFNGNFFMRTFVNRTA